MRGPARAISTSNPRLLLLLLGLHLVVLWWHLLLTSRSPRRARRILLRLMAWRCGGIEWGARVHGRACEKTTRLLQDARARQLIPKNAEGVAPGSCFGGGMAAAPPLRARRNDMPQRRNLCRCILKNGTISIQRVGGDRWVAAEPTHLLCARCGGPGWTLVAKHCSTEKQF
jgi:hypothetical protein